MWNSTLKLCSQGILSLNLNPSPPTSHLNFDSIKSNSLNPNRFQLIQCPMRNLIKCFLKINKQYTHYIPSVEILGDIIIKIQKVASTLFSLSEFILLIRNKDCVLLYDIQYRFLRRF